jgi:branched-chain amino acid aminotransferase
VDEFSTSNFVAITSTSETTTFCAPESPSILNSVTKQSLVQLAKSFGWAVENRVIPFTEVQNNRFEEIAACGTAAVITPVKSIERQGVKTLIGSAKTQAAIGPGFLRLFTAMRGIQNGDLEDPYGWMQPAQGIAPRHEA